MHGMFDLFVTLQTADRHPSKPHPSMLETAMAEAGALPADTVMIGDTVYDIEMALAAGCRAIGVAWGYHDPEELLAAGRRGGRRDARTTWGDARWITPVSDEVARGRWMVINVLRLAGVAMVVVGMLVIAAGARDPRRSPATC